MLTGLDWAATRELITRSGAEARADIWAADGDQVLATIARRFVDLVLPAAAVHRD